VKGNETELKWTVPINKIQKAKKLKLSQLKTEGLVKVLSVTLTADGQNIPLVKEEFNLSTAYFINLELPQSMTGNNECILKIKLANIHSNGSSGKVEMIY